MVDLIQNEALSKQLRARVRKWAKEKEHNFLFQIARYGLTDSGELYLGLKSKVTSKFGMPNKITYSFPRQGIFQELGVGRGENRKPNPWISNALSNKDMDELADIVADAIGDGVIEPITIVDFKK